MVKQEQDLGKIRAKLASSGYTPGRKDVLPLLCLFHDADDAEQKRVVQALTRTSFELCSEALSMLERTDTDILSQARVAISRACHAFPPSNDMAEHCLTDLQAADDSTFRAALRIAAHIATEAPSLFESTSVGSLSEIAPILRTRFETSGETAKRSIARVFGTLAREEDAPWLASLVDAVDPELARLARRSKEILERRLRRTSSETEAPGKLSVPSEAGWRAACQAGDLRVRSKRGLEGFVYRDLKPWLATARRARKKNETRDDERHRNADAERTVLDPGRSHREGVLEGPFSGTLQAFFACRMFDAFAFVIPLSPGPTLEEKIKGTLRSKAFETITRAFSDRVVFRLQLKGKGHQRALVWSVAEWCSAQDSFFRNDSRDAGWMLLVDERANECELVPRLADPRFAYRTADVPAASHPTVAAALATIAYDAWRGRRDLSLQEVVWDPFAGSGLELIEYAHKNPAAKLVATDTSEEAEIAFRKNTETSKTTAMFHRIDARTAGVDQFPESPTLLLTNPPLGHRVPGDVASLADSVLRVFASFAADEARIVWISPDRGTDEICNSLGFRKELEKLVDLGGILRPMQLWARYA